MKRIFDLNLFKLIEGPIDAIKFSADAFDKTYTVGTGELVTYGTPEVAYKLIAFMPEPKLIWTHGEFYAMPQDLSNLITSEQLLPVETAAYGAIQQGTLKKINGKSLEEEDVTLDLTLVRIVETLPTANIDDNKIYLVPNKSGQGSNSFDEYLHHTPETGDPFWELIDKFTDPVDLTGYLKTEDADKKYMKLSNGGSTISTSSQGSLNNYGNNGQAFNAVRDVSTSSITGKPINAASFGVKLDGTTAFTHKTYTTYAPSTGAYTGAKNTAVLTFSGNSGLRYAKNTGSASDVTEDMYKYVGVIDSPDEKQRVYSAKQVDDLLASRDAEIAELRGLIEALTNN